MFATGSAARESTTGDQPDELLAQFAPGVDQDARESAAQLVGGSLVEDIHTQAMQDAGQGILSRIVVTDAPSLEAASVGLAGSPDILHVSPNGLGGVPSVSAAGGAVAPGPPSFSNDPLYQSGQLWGMYGDETVPSNPYGSQAAEAWAAGYTGSARVAVGIVDSGIDPTNPDLYLNIWLNPREVPEVRSVADTDEDGVITFHDLNDSRNAHLSQDANANGYIDARDLLMDPRWSDGADNDGNGYVDDLYGWDFANNDNDPFDDEGHGTHVAGIVGAVGGNGVGVAGVAWSVQLVALKWLSSSNTGFLSDAVEAIDYYTALAISDPTVRYAATNNSWYEFGTAGSQPVRDAVERAADAGTLFITIAGNFVSDNDVVPLFPGNYDTSDDGSWDNVVAIAGIDENGALGLSDPTFGSSYGRTTVDLGAPGWNIVSTDPNVLASTMSGTSMAAPHVTGAAALYAAYDPDASAEEIKAALLASVVPTASLEGRTLTGGLPGGDDLESPPEPPKPGEPVDWWTVSAWVEARQAETGRWEWPPGWEAIVFPQAPAEPPPAPEPGEAVDWWTVGAWVRAHHAESGRWEWPPGWKAVVFPASPAEPPRPPEPGEAVDWWTVGAWVEAHHADTGRWEWPPGWEAVVLLEQPLQRSDVPAGGDLIG
jgi:subtilisin family serine protease